MLGACHGATDELARPVDGCDGVRVVPEVGCSAICSDLISWAAEVGPPDELPQTEDADVGPADGLRNPPHVADGLPKDRKTAENVEI